MGTEWYVKIRDQMSDAAHKKTECDVRVRENEMEKDEIFWAKTKSIEERKMSMIAEKLQLEIKKFGAQEDASELRRSAQAEAAATQRRRKVADVFQSVSEDMDKS